ncbi:methyl-accepting chemotaxis protein [Desulfurivibrio sp. D14AmB]|uniref:methyl-accepting chemotaxis protein n=1 Tax=Desulfurivibrio sp. D14AmB TaxID=3374370 RepID=UPI00376EDA22
MTKTRKLTIGQRLGGGFGVIILVLILIGISNHLSVREMIGQSREIIGDMAMDTELTQREVDHLVWVSRVRDFLAAEGAEPLAVETDHRQCGFGRWYYGEGRRQLERLAPSLTPLLARIEQPHRDLHASAVTLRETGTQQRAAIYTSHTVPALGETQRLLGEIRTGLREVVGERQEAMNSAIHNRSLSINLAVILAVLVAAAIATFSARGIIRMIKEVSGQMNGCSNQVAAAADQVATGGQELAEGASQQAASLEEVSASLEEISASTRQNADNAGQADSLMREAMEVVSRASRSMAELTKAMQTITKSSEETGKIIKTIDEIAFQTNLLALNAAVEAARAGEAGAGFAVVADEVRNLAMRAAEAARDTAAMIDETVGSIRQGSQLVAATGTTFDEVSASTTKATTLIGEIAAASGEQAKGVSQLSQAMGEMDSVVQRTAANAEEAAASGEELHAMATEMQQAVADLLAMVDGEQSQPTAETPKHAWQQKSIGAIEAQEV